MVDFRIHLADVAAEICFYRLEIASPCTTLQLPAEARHSHPRSHLFTRQNYSQARKIFRDSSVSSCVAQCRAVTVSVSKQTTCPHLAAGKRFCFRPLLQKQQWNTALTFTTVCWKCTALAPWGVCVCVCAPRSTLSGQQSTANHSAAAWAGRAEAQSNQGDVEMLIQHLEIANVKDDGMRF